MGQSELSHWHEPLDVFMKTMFSKILTVWGLFALAIVSLQAQDSEYFYLGESFNPSHLKYSNLAERIDLGFEDLKDVHILSLFYPQRQRRIDSSSGVGRNGLTGIELSLEADVTGESWPQTFQCLMAVHVTERRDAALSIYDCKNSNGLIIPFVIFTDMMISFHGRRPRILK